MFTIIQPSERQVIRFGVGSSEAPTSFVWRLWVTRDDAYLGFTPAPFPKVSMHRRVWKIDAGTHRHSFRPVPCRDAAGWTQGPAVMFCHVPYLATPPPPDLMRELSRSKNVRWFPRPPEWWLAEFVAFFGDAELDEDQLPPPDTTIGAEHFAIGPLQCRDGKRLWVRHLTKPIPGDRHEYLLQVRASLKGLKVDKQRDQLHSLGVVMHVHEATLVTVPFGLETIETA